MPSSTSRPMAEPAGVRRASPPPRPAHGLLDTSVIIDHHLVDPAQLPDDSAISSITLAELAAGPHATVSDDERARRQDRLQWASTTWDALPFDVEASRAYGRVFAASRAAGRSSRTRLADLLIASVAMANELPLYTRNPSDLEGLEELVAVVTV